MSLAFATQANQYSALADLRAENDNLRFELKQLKDALTPTDVFPPAWGLTRWERRLIFILLEAAPRMMRKSALVELICDDFNNAPHWKIVDVFVCKVRRKLAVHCPAAVIETVWGDGYRMTREGAEALRKILAEENAPAA
jgi:DNA-binding response OmpR family regulator